MKDIPLTHAKLAHFTRDLMDLNERYAGLDVPRLSALEIPASPAPAIMEAPPKNA